MDILWKISGACVVLNQKLTKAYPEDTRYGAFTRGKSTYVRTWGLKRGEGVCSKGEYFRKLMVHAYMHTCIHAYIQDVG